MKSSTIKNVFFTVVIVSFLFSCEKPNNKPPVADTEFESSIDASWATFVITDIEQICAFMGENQLNTNFYQEIPGSYNAANATGSMIPTRDISDKNINMGFNNTLCYDGRRRDGTVFWYYDYDSDYDKFVTKANPHAKYTHDNAMVARISLVDYKVDGWQIDIDPNQHGLLRAVVANLMPENYVATGGPIRWRIIGDFQFTHPTDASKNMKISVDLVKSLLNSDNPNIYNQALIGSTIKWSDFQPLVKTSTINPSIAKNAALVAYTGTVSGNTTNGARFRMVIDEMNPLLRDFKCYADKIGNLVSSSGPIGLQPIYNEFHPFSQGIVSFTTGCINNPDISTPGISELYPRQIYFGNEDNPGLDLQCNNSGSVLIKGISYNIDFRK